jgi:putative peptidoglycan lipid II flippase
MVLFVASRAAGLLREMAIAHQFGTSAELDAYLAAFRIPDLLFALMAGGALGSAFIPVFSTVLSRGDESHAWRLASAVINWVFLVLSAAGVVAAVAAPLLVSTIIAPGFSPEQQALTVRLMRWMLISTVIFGVSGVVMGILNARQHFWRPAAAPVVYNLAIVAGTLLLGPRVGVMGAVVGVVVGAVGHLLVQVPALRQARMEFSLGLLPTDPAVREVGKLMAPRALGLAAVELNNLVNVILASGLAAGSLAALNYGRLLMLLPQGVIAQSVAIAAFPTFSALVARGERDELRRVLLIALRGVLYLTLPATVGLILLRQPLVATLLQRGAFDAESTRATSWALLFYALGLVAHALVEIVTRAFYALHDTRTPVAVGVAAMAVNAGLSLAFLAVFRSMGWPPFGGLALANSLATTAEMFVLLYLIYGRLEHPRLVGGVAAVARMMLASALMAVSLIGLSRVSGAWPVWAVCLVGIALGALVYGGATSLLGAEEPRSLVQLVRRRLGS